MIEMVREFVFIFRADPTIRVDCFYGNVDDYYGGGGGGVIQGRQ